MEVFMNKRIAFVAMFCVMVLTLISASFINIGFAQAAPLSKTPAIASSGLLADGQAAEKLDLTCQYPVLSSYAGLNYSFDVNVNYTGPGSKVFDLKATFPDGFSATITPGYGSEGKEIAAMRLDGTKGYADSVKVSLTPYAWKVPAPGSYPVTLTVSSGDLKSTIELTAIVTANFDLKLSTPDGRLNTEATAGQDNTFTVVLQNTGSGDLEKLSVSCLAKDRPSGWTVTTKPEKLDSLKSGESKEVQVTIRPSDKTIAGDYNISIQAEPEARIAFANIQIRVTVLTPTIWGWVGVGIVVLVIVALAVIFIRFGRR
jgi:uncharacterized membrane protein